VAVLDLAAFAEKGVGFIEKQNRSPLFRCVENAPQILFRLADVFAHNGTEINAVEVQAQFVCQDFRSHGLAGAAAAGEQRANA
jgi:hypothetical protein